MRLIVGLGNPGPDYAGTPHNLGFEVIERLAGLARLRSESERWRARLWQGRLEGTEVLLAQPFTFMNRSGQAVGPLLRAHRLTPADLIVVTDDVALPLGNIRVRERGSAGGHNGLESVIAALGTEEFLRVRLGFRPPAGEVGELTGYVLRPFGPEEARRAEEMVREAAEAVRVILREGAGRAMARFNRRATPAEPQPPT